MNEPFFLSFRSPSRNPALEKAWIPGQARDDSRLGFTLIELLVVIAIIAVLVAFSATNYVGIRTRAKDLRQKSELAQVKNALRLFFNDYGVYPGPVTTTANDLEGCGTGTLPATSCQEACAGQFGAGATGCDTVYMKLLPPASEYTWSYRQIDAGDDFCLWTALENNSDAEIAKSQARCASACTGVVSSTDYVLCTD